MLSLLLCTIMFLWCSADLSIFYPGEVIEGQTKLRVPPLTSEEKYSIIEQVTLMCIDTDTYLFVSSIIELELTIGTHNFKELLK